MRNFTLLFPLLVIFSFLLTNTSNGQVTLSDEEKQIIAYIYSHDFDFAERMMYEILEVEPDNLFALFNLARMRKEQFRVAKQADRYNMKYKDFSTYFDWLTEGNEKILAAQDVYHALPEDQKAQALKHLPATHAEMETDLVSTLENEAYNLINQCNYRKPLSKLYGTKIYNRVTDVDTLTSLRESLFEQTTRFMQSFSMSNYIPNVYEIRKELLQEYIQVRELRKYGDRSGGMYEKNCEEIQLLFGEEELMHVLPQFYGAEFGWEGDDYMMTETFQELTMIAAQKFMSVRDLLCQLNLHYGGANDDNRLLYDKFIETMAPLDIALVAVKQLAAPHVNAHDVEKTIEVFEQYRHLFPEQQRYFDQMVALMKEEIPEVTVSNLGFGVNTLAKEYQPVVTLDGERLYFARKTDDYGEDIFYSMMMPNNEWGASMSITDNLNTQSHEIPLSISPDGNTFFIYGNYAVLPQYAYIRNRAKHLGKGDFYYAERLSTGWGRISVLPEPINTPNFEAGLSMTADGGAIFFCSDREGAVGGHNPNYPKGKLYYHGSGEFNTDLYVCEKIGDNEWGEVINLGEVINTPFAEKNPFLAPDMKTLYFSSDGHYGFGGYDIFMSKRLNDSTWTEWSEPKNLGRALNSPYDDAVYLSPNGSHAFIVSNRDGESYGKTDIYSMELPLDARPEPMVIISGRITGPDNKPIETNVVWHELGKPKKGGIVPVQKGTGKFTFAVKPGKVYTYYPEKDKHLSSSARVDLSKIDTAFIYKDDPITLHPIQKLKMSDTPIVLAGVEFDFNSDNLREESKTELNRLVKLMTDYPDYIISIEGHTDSKGNDNFNLDLSSRRAASVKTYLVEQGIGEKRMMSKGYGEKKPIATNDTEFGRQKNRRVEFRIL